MGHHDILQIWINCRSWLVAETYHVSEKHSKMPKIGILSYIIAAPKYKYLKSSLVFVRLASLCANSWGKKNKLKRWCSNTCHVWFEMEPKFFWEAIQNRVYELRLHLPLTYSKSDSLNKSIQEYIFFLISWLLYIPQESTVSADNILIWVIRCLLLGITLKLFLCKQHTENMFSKCIPKNMLIYMYILICSIYLMKRGNLESLLWEPSLVASIIILERLLKNPVYLFFLQDFSRCFYRGIIPMTCWPSAVRL